MIVLTSPERIEGIRTFFAFLVVMMDRAYTEATEYELSGISTTGDIPNMMYVVLMETNTISTTDMPSAPVAYCQKEMPQLSVIVFISKNIAYKAM